MTIQTSLTIKQLRAFVAVYRLQRLAPAAERLSVTQSAVSLLIRQTENSLGTALFDRRARTLAPTQAAHEAIGLAERVLRDLELLDSSVRDLGEHRRGRVHLAVTPAVATALLPDVVRRFVQDHPEIRVLLDDCAPDQFIQRVVSEQVEFGIGTPEHASLELSTETLLQDRLCVVCPVGHLLTRLRRVRWADLRGVPLIAPRPGYGVRRSIDAIAAKAGVDLRITNEVAFLSSALWMTSSGLGVSIWPSALLRNAPYANLVTLQLVAPVAWRSVSLVVRRGRSLSPACQAFVQALKDDLARKPAAGST